MTIRYNFDTMEYEIAVAFRATDGELPVSALVDAATDRVGDGVSSEQVAMKVREMAAGDARFEIDDDGVVHNPTTRALDRFAPDDDGDDGDNDPHSREQKLTLSLGM